MKQTDHDRDVSSLIVKINFLVLALGLVTYFMYHLNQRGLPSWAQSFVSSKKAEPELTHITLCETRISDMIVPDQYKISQDGRRWVREGKTAKELDFLSVEKWFGANCTLPAQELKKPVSRKDGKPVLLVKFVTDRVEPLFKTSQGEFLWQGQSFRSPVLEAALKELNEIPTRDAR